jgi:hypothetical protein
MRRQLEKYRIIFQEGRQPTYVSEGPCVIEIPVDPEKPLIEIAKQFGVRRKGFRGAGISEIKHIVADDIEETIWPKAKPERKPSNKHKYHFEAHSTVTLHGACDCYLRGIKPLETDDINTATALIGAELINKRIINDGDPVTVTLMTPTSLRRRITREFLAKNLPKLIPRS